MKLAVLCLLLCAFMHANAENPTDNLPNLNDTLKSLQEAFQKNVQPGLQKLTGMLSEVASTGLKQLQNSNFTNNLSNFSSFAFASSDGKSDGNRQARQNAMEFIQKLPNLFNQFVKNLNANNPNPAPEN